MFWIEQDERSLSEILKEAVSHYENHRRTGNQGEKFAYIYEMLSLQEHVFLLYIKADQDSDTENLARHTEYVLDNTDAADYSRRELDDLFYVIDELEKPKIPSVTFRECEDRLKKIMAK